MASSTRSGRILKHEGHSSTRSVSTTAKVKDTKDSPNSCSTATSTRKSRSSTTSGSAAADSSSLRRSFREIPHKKMTESSPSSRKSGRLENQATSTHSDMKVEGPDKKRPHSPLRRSERIEKNGISSSPGSKKLNESSSSPLKKKRLDKNGKTDVTSTEKHRNSKKHAKSSVMPRKKKRLDARRYRALIQPKKDEYSDGDNDMHLKDDNSALKGNSSNSASSGKVHEDESNGRKDDKLLGEFSIDNSKEAADGASSSLREIAELNTCGHGPRQSACLSGKKKFKDKLPASKFGGSSLHSSLVEFTTKDNIGCVSERERLGGDTTHDAHKLDMEEVESSGLVASTSKGKFLAGDTGNRCSHNAEISVSDATSSSPCETTSKDFKKCTVCNKLERVDGVSEAYELCLCKTQREHDLMPSVIEDRGTFGVSDGTYTSEEHLRDAHLKESVAVQMDSSTNACVVCKHPGQLLCCDGKGCNRSYHLSCLNPPLQDVPPGFWLCHLCVKKKVESGVYSVSEGIESVWDVKEGSQNEKHYFVKYKGLAHVHNRWVPGSQILFEAPMLVAKFEKKHKKEKVSRWKQDWTELHRLLQKRQLLTKKFSGDGDTVSYCYNEWLVKWKHLGYENATWELENSPFLCSPVASKLMIDFKRRHEEARKRSDPLEADKALQVKRSPFHKLTKLSDECPDGLDNDHLNSVNRLREFWHKSQNAIFIDDQERIIKTVLFVSTLQSHTCRPILIISTIHSLSLWEAEFSRLAPSINVVVYAGPKYVRKMVHTLEFYEEGGCVMFQVLLSHPDSIIEDFDSLDCIGWEALIIDDSQNSRASKHLEQFKNLSTEFRLLLMSSQLKDNVVEYVNLLSFLEPGGKDNISVSSKYGTNDTAGALPILKEKLTRYLAYERKPGSSKFREYWVPVRLSNVQLEVYCSALVSNFITLRSCSKIDQVGALREILISTRKCCDHPYLVVKSLQASLMKDLPSDNLLDIGVKASGKLQLLDKFLHEMKIQGLRVLILFQSIGGAGRNSIGDILDDFIQYRFGPDSYERVDSGLIMSKKLAATSKFNDKAKGRFVFLIENRACLPSIKLSSVDAVVIFNSDWNPLNDLRSLQRIHIETQSEHVKVFRLYSACTVEEKLLIFAKEDIILDSNIQNISTSNSHLLLSWGAFHLFKELDEFHRHYSICSIDNCLSTDSTLKFLNDVLGEVVRELLEKAEDDSCQCFLLIKAQQSGASYSRNISLVGEKDGMSSLDKDPSSFWSNLLEKRYPKWRFICEPSQRIRRKVKYFEESLKTPEVENSEVSKKRRKLSTNTVDPICLQTCLEDKTRGLSEGSKVADDSFHGAHIHPASVSPTTTPSLPNNVPKEPETYDNRSIVGSRSMPSTASIMNDVAQNLQASSASDDASELHKFSMGESEGRRNAQKTLLLRLKPELSELCDTLKLSDDVKGFAHLLLEYIMNNHHVNREPETILQAFKLSLCWRAASFLKHKVDHKECLEIAKKYLNYACNEEQADSVYSKLRMLKQRFSQMGVSRLEDVPNSSETHSSESKKAEATKKIHGETSESAASYHKESEEIKVVSDCEEAHLGSLKDELLEKRVDLIDVICSKREDALLLMQQQELSEFNVHREEEKIRLKNEYNDQLELICSIHTDYILRNDKIKLLNQDFSKKMAKFDHHMKCQRKKLADMQEESKNKELNIRNRWVEEAKAGSLTESFDALPLTESGFSLEEFMEVPEQVKAFDSSQNKISASMPPSDRVCSDIGITENGMEIPSTFCHGNVEDVQHLASRSNNIAEVEPIGTSAKILETSPPNMVDMESIEPNETSTQITGPTLNVMCNDVITSVPGMSRGTTESLLDMPSTSSIGRIKDVHFLTSLSANLAQAEPSQSNGISAEMLDTVPHNIAQVGPIELNKTSTYISMSAGGGDIRIPLSDPEAKNISVNQPDSDHVEPLKSNVIIDEIQETIQPDMVEVESVVPNEPATSLPAGDADISNDNGPPFSESNIFNELGNRPKTTHMVPSIAPSSLLQETESPAFQSINMVEVEPLEPNRASAGVRPSILSSNGDISREVEAPPFQMNRATRMAEDGGIHEGEDVDKSDDPTRGSSSPDNPGELPEMIMVGDEPHEILKTSGAATAVIDRGILEDEYNSERTNLPSSPPQNPVDLPSISRSPTNSCCEMPVSPNLALSDNGCETRAVGVVTEYVEGISSSQATISLTFDDGVTSQIEPSALHANALNSTPLHGPPVDNLSTENDHHAFTHQESPPFALRNEGEFYTDDGRTSQPTALSMQQPNLSAQMQAEECNQLNPQSSLHMLHPEGIYCSTSQSEVHVQQPVVTVAMQAALSNSIISQSVVHQPLPSANLLPERTNSEGIGIDSVLQESGSRLVQILPLTAWVHPQALHPDPLQNELTRLRKQVELRTKMHEDKNLQLKLECEQEIEKVRQKYDTLLQSDEAAFRQDKKILETIYSKVLVNQILAEEFRAKFIDTKGGTSASCQGRSSNSTQQFLQTSQAPNVPRPPSASSSIHVPILANLPTLPNPTRTSSTPPLATSGAQVPSGSAAPAGIGVRQSHSANPANNVRSQFSLAARPSRQGVTDVRVPASRAPAPHLQRFRPPSMLAPILPPPSNQLSSQQYARLNLCTATPPAHIAPVHAPRVPLSRTYQSVVSLPQSHDRALPTVELPRDLGNTSVDMPNLSILEPGSSLHSPLPSLLRDLGNTSVDMPNPLGLGSGSSLHSPFTSKLPVNGSEMATSTTDATKASSSTADVVCLSDDE